MSSSDTGKVRGMQLTWESLPKAALFIEAAAPPPRRLDRSRPPLRSLFLYTAERNADSMVATICCLGLNL